MKLLILVLAIFAAHTQAETMAGTEDSMSAPSAYAENPSMWPPGQVVHHPMALSKLIQSGEDRTKAAHDCNVSIQNVGGLYLQLFILVQYGEGQRTSSLPIQISAQDLPLKAGWSQASAGGLLSYTYDGQNLIVSSTMETHRYVNKFTVNPYLTHFSMATASYKKAGLKMDGPTVNEITCHAAIM